MKHQLFTKYWYHAHRRLQFLCPQGADQTDRPFQKATADAPILYMIHFDQELEIIMFFLLLALVLVTGQSEPITRTQLADRAIEARKSLGPNYRISLTIESSIEVDGKKKLIIRSALSVWAKGELRRNDHTHIEYPEHPDQQGLRRVHCRNCERKGYAMTTTIGSKNLRYVVEFQPLEKIEVASGWPIDWRLIGQLGVPISGYLHETPDERFLTIKERGIDPVLRKVLAGQQCLTVRNSIYSGEAKTWFREDLNMSPVLFEDRMQNGRFWRRSEVTYQQLAGSGVWFPKTIMVANSSTSNPKEIERETITIDDAEFDADIPDKVFTTAGLGLDVGQAIKYPETKSGSEPIWRDGKVDKSTTLTQETIKARAEMLKAPPPPPTPDTPPPSNRPLLLAGAALLALAGVAVFVVARRRSRQF